MESFFECLGSFNWLFAFKNKAWKANCKLCVWEWGLWTDRLCCEVISWKTGFCIWRTSVSTWHHFFAEWSFTFFFFRGKSTYLTHGRQDERKELPYTLSSVFLGSAHHLASTFCNTAGISSFRICPGICGDTCSCSHIFWRHLGPKFLYSVRSSTSPSSPSPIHCFLVFNSL